MSLHCEYYDDSMDEFDYCTCPIGAAHVRNEAQGDNDNG
jgi:hypothetical protein